MKTLVLPVKKKWFDLIKAGEPKKVFVIRINNGSQEEK